MNSKERHSIKAPYGVFFVHRERAKRAEKCYTGTMSGIPPIGPGGGGFDPDRKKSPEERQAEAERLKKERKRKREEIAAKQSIEKKDGRNTQGNR